MSERIDYDHRYCTLNRGDMVAAYTIQRKIGKGAYCTVYDVTSSDATSNQSNVAIKIYRAGYSNKDAFNAELHALIHLNNSACRINEGFTNIMKYYGYFAHLAVDITADITAESLKSSIHPCVIVGKYGDSVDELWHVFSDGLDINNAKRIFRQLCCGLKYIHRCGIAHGDIKTANILMNKKAEDLLTPQSLHDVEIVISDFNHSRFISNQECETVGTQVYCAPEVMLKLPWSTPADIWSAGCVFYELLTTNDLFTIEEDSDTELSESTDGMHIDGGTSTSIKASTTTPPKRATDHNSHDDHNSHNNSHDDNSYDSSDDANYSSSGGFDPDVVYSHLSGIYQLLGKPPTRFIKGGRDYYNSKGYLKHNPDLKTVNLREVMTNEFNCPRGVADSVHEFLLKMIKYRPEERATASALLESKFLRNIEQQTNNTNNTNNTCLLYTSRCV